MKSGTCDLSFLHGEGNDKTEGTQRGLHPIHSADGVICGLNQNQREGESIRCK